MSGQNGAGSGQGEPAKTTQQGSGPEAPPEAPVAKETEKPAEENIKPSAPGETGTTPGTNWKQ